MVTPVIDANGEVSGYVAVIRDVTEERQHEQNPIDAALTDPATRLYNRRGLESRARELADRHVAEPTAVAWVRVDIDRFKRVDDTDLHEGGDAVLQAVAAGLQLAVRGGDTLARVGGEAFALLLPDTTAGEATAIAERLRLGIEAMTIAVGGRDIRVTASFGVAIQAPDEDWNSALQRADSALFQARQEGRNGVALAPEPAAPRELLPGS
jgi:two-component system cell cycle response regulator